MSKENLQTIESLVFNFNKEKTYFSTRQPKGVLLCEFYGVLKWFTFLENAIEVSVPKFQPLPINNYDIA